MPSTTKAKAKPIGVSTPYQDVVQYVALNEEKKAAERTLKSLKPRVMALLPSNRDVIVFDRDEAGAVPIYRGKRGQYKVQRVTTDRREPSNELLENLLMERNLYTEGTTTTTAVDQEKVAQLVEAGKLTAKDIESCMIGAKYSYILVNFEPLK